MTSSNLKQIKQTISWLFVDIAFRPINSVTSREGVRTHIATTLCACETPENGILCGSNVTVQGVANSKLQTHAMMQMICLSWSDRTNVGVEIS